VTDNDLDNWYADILWKSPPEFRAKFLRKLLLFLEVPNFHKIGQAEEKPPCQKPAQFVTCERWTDMDTDADTGPQLVPTLA